MLIRIHLVSFLTGLIVAGTACSSHSDNVCQDIGDCSYRGDNDWIASCQAEANAQGAEAEAAGCGPTFGAYYACADSSYACHGATAVFPGCDDELAALDACLAAATTGTACAELAAAEAGCAPPAGDLPPACTAARDCQARCYLMNVANPCAPRVDELEATTACASTCPP